MRATPVVPDPTEPDILYGAGAGRCNQALNVPSSLGGTLRRRTPTILTGKTWTLPGGFLDGRMGALLLFEPIWYFAREIAGRRGRKISPDLTRVNPPMPANLDPVTAKDIDEAMTNRFGVVATRSARLR